MNQLECNVVQHRQGPVWGVAVDFRKGEQAAGQDPGTCMDLATSCPTAFAAMPARLQPPTQNQEMRVSPADRRNPAFQYCGFGSSDSDNDCMYADCDRVMDSNTSNEYINNGMNSNIFNLDDAPEFSDHPSWAKTPTEMQSVSSSRILTLTSLQELPQQDLRNRRDTSSNSSSMKALISFEGSEVQLTGVSLDSVLRRRCKIFSSRWSPSTGSAAQAAAQENVEQLDYFVSHNWSVSRARKMIALYVHFNMTFAAVGSFLICVAIILGVHYCEGPLPGYTYRVGAGHWEGMLFQLTFCPAFLLCLLSGSDFARMLRTQQKTVFLDRLCIDQFNQDLKQEGILRLGAFINSSREMIVLYTDVYLQRVWTIYEVAAFFTLHDIRRMKVLQLEKTTLLFCNIFLGYGTNLVTLLSLVGFQSFPLVIFTYYCAAVALCMVYRKFRKRKRVTLDKLERFRLEECTCSDERDRPLVYRNIATLFRGVGKVDPDCSEEEALQAFEQMVRYSLPSCLGRRTFQVQYQYHQYLILGFFYGGPLCFDILSGVLRGGSQKRPSAQFLFALLLERNLEWISFYPMCMMTAEFVSHCCMHLEGWREILYIGPTFTFAFAFNCTLQLFLRELAELAGDSLPALLFLISVAVVMTGFVCRLATYFAESRDKVWTQDPAPPERPNVIGSSHSDQGSPACPGTPRRSQQQQQQQPFQQEPHDPSREGSEHQDQVLIAACRLIA